MMDHSLRTISYIADIGDILVLYSCFVLFVFSPGNHDGPFSKDDIIHCRYWWSLSSILMFCLCFHQEIMMDHSLRTISYIADIGDILVIMARRRLITSPDEQSLRRRRQAKILCHVFESDEVRLVFIVQCILTASDLTTFFRFYCFVICFRQDLIQVRLLAF